MSQLPAKWGLVEVVPDTPARGIFCSFILVDWNSPIKIFSLVFNQWVIVNKAATRVSELIGRVAAGR